MGGLFISYGTHRDNGPLLQPIVVTALYTHSRKGERSSSNACDMASVSCAEYLMHLWAASCSKYNCNFS